MEGQERLGGAGNAGDESETVKRVDEGRGGSQWRRHVRNLDLGPRVLPGEVGCETKDFGDFWDQCRPGRVSYFWKFPSGNGCGILDIHIKTYHEPNYLKKTFLGLPFSKLETLDVGEV